MSGRTHRSSSSTPLLAGNSASINDTSVSLSIRDDDEDDEDDASDSLLGDTSPLEQQYWSTSSLDLTDTQDFERCPIAWLPPEVLLMIAHKVADSSLRDLASLSQTCKLFNSISWDNRLWYNLYVIRMLNRGSVAEENVVPIPADAAAAGSSNTGSSTQPGYSNDVPYQAASGPGSASNHDTAYEGLVADISLLMQLYGTADPQAFKAMDTGGAIGHILAANNRSAPTSSFDYPAFDHAVNWRHRYRDAFVARKRAEEEEAERVAAEVEYNSARARCLRCLGVCSDRVCTFEVLGSVCAAVFLFGYAMLPLVQVLLLGLKADGNEVLSDTSWSALITPTYIFATPPICLFIAFWDGFMRQELEIADEDCAGYCTRIASHCCTAPIFASMLILFPMLAALKADGLMQASWGEVFVPLFIWLGLWCCFTCLIAAAFTAQRFETLGTVLINDVLSDCTNWLALQTFGAFAIVLAVYLDGHINSFWYVCIPAFLLFVLSSPQVLCAWLRSLESCVGFLVIAVPGPLTCLLYALKLETGLDISYTEALLPIIIAWPLSLCGGAAVGFTFAQQQAQNF